MIFLTPTFRQTNRLQQQTGFILLPVVIAIVIIATVAFMLNNQSAINSHSLGGESQGQQAEYVAEAGFNHALWQTNNSSCSNYPNPLESSFGVHKYSASVTPTSGSPVAISATGTLANGSTRSLQRNNIAIYQPPIILAMQPDATEGKDTHIYQWKPTWNFGVDPNLVVSGTLFSFERSLVQFDLSAIPAGVEIISAKLELRSNSSSWVSTQVNVHRVTKDWVEGNADGTAGIEANWNDPGIGPLWDTAGGDFDATVSASATTPGNSAWVSWDIAGMVGDWVNGTAPNYGLMLRAVIPTQGAQFDSSDAATAANRPKLTITYVCECGVGSSGSSSLQPDAATGIDGYSNQQVPANNYGTSTFLAINTGAGATKNALLKFALSELPSGATVVSAQLNMYLGWVNGASGASVSAHRMLQPWTEGIGDNWTSGDGATWNTSNGSASWSWPGNYESTAVAQTPLVSGSGWHSWDISTLVTGWHDGSFDNDGLVLVGSGSITDASFYSSDHSTAIERPTLTVSYTCPCGVDCSVTAPPSSPTIGYFDEFNNLTCNAAVDYIGSDGTLDWGPWAWSEIVDSGDSCSGAIKLKDDAGDNVLRFSGDGNGIMRQVDLSGFTGAVLSFDYRRSGFDDVNDYLTVEVSADGGTIWNQVGRIEGPATDTDYLSASYDISSYMASNTAIRFVTVGLGGSGPNTDLIYLDRVKIVEGAPAPSTAPIAHWKLDESSGLIAVDSEGGHDGTLANGPLWTGGQLNGALQFDGINDVIEVAHDDNLSLSHFTISAWIHPDTVSGFHSIVYKGATTAEANYHFYTSGDEFTLGLTNGGWQYYITSTNANLVSGQWSLVTASFDGGSGDVKLYLDGALIDSGTIAAAVVLNNGPITIGSDPYNEHWQGRLDDVRIYDRVLSAIEIADLASVGGGGGGGPLPSSGEVSFEEYAQTSLASNGRSMNISKPGGTAAGDLLIAVIVTDGEQKKEMSASGGWILIDHGRESKQVTMDVWWKLADASEPVQYAFDWKKPEEAYGWIMRFTGHDPGSPINVFSSAGGSSNSPTSPAVTTTVANAMILRIGGFDDDDITAGNPGLTGYTAITMGDSGDGANTASGGAGYMTQAVTGDSGTADFSLTTTEEYRAVTIGITPAP